MMVCKTSSFSQLIPCLSWNIISSFLINAKFARRRLHGRGSLRIRILLQGFNFRNISLLSQSKFRRFRPIVPAAGTSGSGSSSSSPSSFQDRLRRPKCKRHEESYVACLTQFLPEEAAIASTWFFNREGRKRQPVPTSWLDSRCNSLSSCRPGITRRCNTPPLSLLMNNRTREIVCESALRCKDLRLDSRIIEHDVL